MKTRSTSHEIQESPARSKTVLLVDDEPSVRELVGRVLKCENYEVITAENGLEALRLAGQGHIDIVLLDLNLPVKNGWDTFERLTYDHPLVPVIIITARPNQFFSAVGAGAGALLEKPLDFPTLLKTIETLLAEPLETRLARLAGKSAAFHYQPAVGG
ncbi:MAG TPA: response regulator [Candidatus Saccharimonadales bacterium]|nr:response regulator [Candidatus Saccharimonadales bacterium]